ncbi:MAG TPA: hypothetical protein VFL38_07365, partial [Humibacillus xanthopallidus]|nr:hypothetical protein [Humibacillus xanthopallidus]
DQATLYREFGITADAVVKAAKDSLKAAGAAARTAPRVTETNPSRAAQSASTDVMGSDVEASDKASQSAASATSKGK